MTKSRKAVEQLVYQIKVTLKGSKPPIWRRILVTEGTTLGRLHGILQAVMGWQDYHLHEFTVAGREYGISDPEYDIFDEPVADERRARLGQLLSSEGFRFTYVYDFGDNWEHELLIEKILRPESGVHYPVCVRGKRACSPEDCGGIWGYYELLEAIQDPDHPEHAELKEWLGDEFDPDEFDLDAINRRCEALL